LLLDFCTIGFSIYGKYDSGYTQHFSVPSAHHLTQWRGASSTRNRRSQLSVDTPEGFLALGGRIVFRLPIILCSCSRRSRFFLEASNSNVMRSII
jgi:hypothetical protein